MAAGWRCLLFALASPARATSIAIPDFLRATSAGRELALCERHDETDSSIARCDEWCKYPAHCEFCKCRGCSLCKPCVSTEPGDIPYEGCEDWCSVPEHCSHCKCKACSVCKACTPFDASDTDYEDAQPWCTEKAHCQYVLEK